MTSSDTLSAARVPRWRRCRLPGRAHVYVELVLDDESGAEAARRYPGVAAHLLGCGPCAEDYRGLLLAVRPNPG